jgi:hypothetical protein
VPLLVRWLSSLISGAFAFWTTSKQTRESRLAVAAELTRLNQERYIEAGRNSPGAEMELQDPANVMRFYLAELDAMAKQRAALKADWSKVVDYRAKAKP